MASKKTILVSNDDGFRSEGIAALRAAMEPLGEVYVVAPDREQSAASHALTLHRPLRVEKLSERVYAVDGTPTDCVTLALGKVLSVKPDLVVSGINNGANLGEDTLYSGTVSAAMEGTVLGIPSVAFSLKGHEEDGVVKFDYAAASLFAAKLCRYILDKGMPTDTLLNVNVPSGVDIKGHRTTILGNRTFGENVVEKTDPRGKKYYWIGGDMEKWEGGARSDFQALEDGYISVTPLHLDLTNHSLIEEIGAWNF